MPYFNSRSHEESDKEPPIPGSGDERFQFTLSRRERPLQGSLPSPRRNFNSRSHEESDAVLPLHKLRYLDFNSRSHEESDSPLSPKRLSASYFNSRSHEESDTIIACNFKQNQIVLSTIKFYVSFLR